MRRIRIFFTTDLHGATAVFRKALKFAEKYRIKNVIVGGDITGKVLVPIKYDEKEGSYSISIPNILSLTSKNLEDIMDKIRPIEDRGVYTYVDMAGLDQDSIFIEKMIERLGEWIDMAYRIGKEYDIRFYFMAGNDDPDEIVEYLEDSQSEYCIHVDNRIVELEGGLELLSSGYSNMTPWRLPRDIPDEKFEEILYSLAEDLNDGRKSIFNIHAPPYGTNIDLAPLLDETMKPVLKPGGGYEMVNVGSRAVRKVIEDYQPVLSLHGHIHESRGFHKIGKTLAINPGSEYQEGVLRGAVVVINIDKARVDDFILVQA